MIDEKQKAALLEAFKQAGDGVLLGTASFWEGVDVRGEALSCVIIDKLPFASPSDPVLSARLEAIKKQGALEVYAAITHPVLCGPALERIKKSSLKELIVTDTIPIPKEKMLSKIRVLSVASILGEAIKRIHCAESISVLFTKGGV